MNKVLSLLMLMSFNLAAAPEIQTWQTSKGIDVYFVESHHLPMIDLQLVFDAGSVRDPVSKRGLSSITNSLIGQSADGLNADQISFEFESLGAQFSTSSGYDSANISLRSLSDAALLGPALINLRRVMSFPDFPDEVFERERNQTLVGIQRKLQSPRSISSDKFYEAIYQGHPYAYPNEGTAESLAGITREDLINFHTKFYTAGNVMITIVGDLDRVRAENLAETITKDLTDGDAPAGFPQVSSLKKEETIKVYHPSTQVNILVGQPGMKYGDPDYFPLYVGNHILGGGGLVSRLFDEIREKRGLSYGASSYFSPRRELGPFLSNISTREDQADEALSVLQETISEYINNGPTDAELNAAKKNITGGFPLRINSNSKISGYISVIGFYGLPLDYLDKFNEKIEAVTVDQINDAFRRRIDTNKFVTVLVGPVEEDK
jgi:zinc protease